MNGPATEGKIALDGATMQPHGQGVTPAVAAAAAAAAPAAPAAAASMMAMSTYNQKVIEKKEQELRDLVIANYSRIRDVERELSQLQLQVHLTSGPKRHALEMMRKKIEVQNEKVVCIRQRYTAAKQVFLAVEAELKKEEEEKDKLCDELNLLIQQSTTLQLSKLEELRQHLEMLNQGMAPNHYPSTAPQSTQQQHPDAPAQPSAAAATEAPLTSNKTGPVQGKQQQPEERVGANDLNLNPLAGCSNTSDQVEKPAEPRSSNGSGPAAEAPKKQSAASGSDAAAVAAAAAARSRHVGLGRAKQAGAQQQQQQEPHSQQQEQEKQRPKQAATMAASQGGRRAAGPAVADEGSSNPFSGFNT